MWKDRARVEGVMMSCNGAPCTGGRRFELLKLLDQHCEAATAHEDEAEGLLKFTYKASKSQQQEASTASHPLLNLLPHYPQPHCTVSYYLLGASGQVQNILRAVEQYGEVGAEVSLSIIHHPS